MEGGLVRLPLLALLLGLLGLYHPPPRSRMASYPIARPNDLAFALFSSSRMRRDDATTRFQVEDFHAGNSV
jgi:hypothetical protein